jgi:hypothetical protein
MSPTSKPAPAQRSSRRGGWWIGGGIVLAIIIVAAILGSIALARSGEGTHPGVSNAAADSSAPRASDASPSAPASAPASDPPASDAPTPGASSSPIPFDKVAEPARGVTISLSTLEAVNGTGTGIGKIDGPSIRFHVVFANSAAKAASLAGVVVNVYYGADARPASRLDGPGGVDLPDSVAAGASAAGVYIYNIPTAQRNDVRITISLTTAAPVTVFEGSAPR